MYFNHWFEQTKPCVMTKNSLMKNEVNTMLDYATVKAIEHEFPELISKIHSQMKHGLPPEDPETQKLAKRWNELFEMLSGGELEVSQIIKNQYNEPSDSDNHKLDSTFLEYISKAMAVVNFNSYH